MTDNKAKQRVEKLFAGMERPDSSESPKRNGHGEPVVTAPANGGGSQSNKPAPVSPNEKEVEALKARILELESRLKENESQISSAPLLYEKEEVGFAYMGDQVLPVRGDQPEVRNEANVVKSPLTFSGKTIGEVQVAQSPERPLTQDDIKLANTVAQQASLQIENLRLLAAAERARAEAEDATHQFTHRNWANFLDAIHNSERIGYVYDQAAVEPFTQPAPTQYDHEEIMQVLDQQVGRLFVKGNGTFTEEDKTLVQAIAKQVGQQVENIRLLADASRARAEAEEATRRLTRQNWDSYAQQEGAATGFMYDSIKVSPMANETIAAAVDLQQPLMVRGEPIGQLSVSGLTNVSEEAKELAASIAKQTSIHLETLRLTEELQKRAQELKELDRLKSAFLANMSHELRTPMNSILGFTDVMLEGLDGPLTENMDNDLRLIQKNGQHLLHLINDVLDMAKIESGKMNLNLEKFRAHALLDDVVSITSTLAADKKLSLVIDDASDQTIEVYADNTRLRQVMINLVNNAIKFTEAGKVTICAKPVAGARILISVKDTGIGIPQNDLESVFQEFTQVDVSTTRKAGGTGLGLPISRRLVEMHGGRLWAESAGIHGEGSTFFVEMPLEARVTEVVEKREK
ncbi:MAG: Sensor histidine kinase RcsC [Anaerolineales bacterium]|nr:Sensor histidine kinase RcsC [Anaerolineales bacterium]